MQFIFQNAEVFFRFDLNNPILFFIYERNEIIEENYQGMEERLLDLEGCLDEVLLESDFLVEGRRLLGVQGEVVDQAFVGFF
jgi:hypothetical protein